MKKILIFGMLLSISVQVWAQLPGQAELAKAKAAHRLENYPEAFKWFGIAAEKGNPDAMYNLAYMYEYGEGMDQDYPTAMSWYRKAIAKGNIPSMIALGIIYQNTDMYQEAENSYRLAAEKGSAEGMELLGNLFFLHEKYVQALDCYKKAAAKGKRDSMYQIGEMYEQGFGIKADAAEAKRWFQQAAVKGHELAKEKLEGQ